MESVMDLSSGSLFLFGALMTWLNPLWMVAVGMAAALGTLVGLYFLLQLAVPKIAAIAWVTGREALWQPVFWVVLSLASLLLILFTFLPYNTFGEDIKMVKDTGLTLIVVWTIVVALWSAGVSIADEIEGRTALTLLSKPIGRRSFILGKFLGIVGTVAIMFVLLGGLFLATVSYKVVYDARETNMPAPTTPQCAAEMEQILPGLALAFLETIVLTSIGVAISTRLPILPNLVICVSIYILGHLVPLLADPAVGQHPIVSFVGTFLAVILPVLDHFNIYGAIAAGNVVPWSYVGMAALYCLLYSSVAMLLALLMFEDRDLA